MIQHKSFVFKNKTAVSTSNIFHTNHCKPPEWIHDLEMPCLNLEIQEFLEDSINGEPAEMTESSPTSETIQQKSQ